MDIGKFKSSRGRLILWILIPSVLIASVGLSTFALRMQSEWQLTRAQRLGAVFPQLVKSREQAATLLQGFQRADSINIDSENELISFLQDRALKVGFTVDSLNVERLAGKNGALPMLTARVQGSGELNVIYRLLADVSSAQQLLSESELQVSQMDDPKKQGLYQAEINFELILFKIMNAEERS